MPLPLEEEEEIGFAVVVSQCAAEIHEPVEDDPLPLCVRIGGVSVCGWCVELYSFGFDEAVARWRAGHQRGETCAGEEAKWLGSS